MKGLRVTKMVKENKIERVCGKSELKKRFAETIIPKILETYEKQRSTKKV